MGKTNHGTYKYTDAAIQQCIRAIQNHVPVKKACKQYNIPRSTVKYRLGKNWSGRTRKGPPTALSDVEENEIVAWIKRMARKGYPITKKHLILAVKQHLSKYPRAKSCNMNAGQRWYKAFMKRHPDLTIRKPEAVSAASANVTEENIRHWFQSVYEILVEEGQNDILSDPTRVFNGDEIGFSLDPETKAVICSKSEKNVYVIDTGSKKNITVLNTYGASGVAIPPCVVLPYQRIPLRVAKSFPPSWGVGKSETGWMTKEAFMGYITNVFHPYLIREKVQLPVVLFVDGHRSHTPFETAEECVKLDIILISLYANSTHILQPADVAIFRSLKASWTNQVRIWQAEHPGKTIRLDEFGCILEMAINSSFKSKTVINGFRACGLYPFNADAVDYSKCIARKHDDQLPQEKSGGEESVLISCQDIQNAINLIPVRKAALYRVVEMDDFANEDDKIVCSIYKKILAPLDERDMPEEESIGVTEFAAHSEKLNVFKSPIALDESIGTSENVRADRTDGTTQTDRLIIEVQTFDEVCTVSMNTPNSLSGQELQIKSDCVDFCRIIQHSEIVDADDLPQLHNAELYTVSSDEHVNKDIVDTGFQFHQSVVTPFNGIKEESGVSQQAVQKGITKNLTDKTPKTYFDEPQTPAKKRKKFKHAKSPPVLTSKKRLELHQAKQAAKENIREEKQMKSEKKRAERMKKIEMKKLSAITKLEEKLTRLKTNVKF
ncbi:uncharacterized protein LOC131693263 [Topomyia yanbarensis]|uniref:uncharacterized protein LOC131693263 n=1 Tax=Topomyia yanbarensis TaxID=2498891 RepID=UPI00273BEEB7|nr:uncharacterized protein LOC131693263 [Topomyia yanbarensis]